MVGDLPFIGPPPVSIQMAHTCLIVLFSPLLSPISVSFGTTKSIAKSQSRSNTRERGEKGEGGRGERGGKGKEMGTSRST